MKSASILIVEDDKDLIEIMGKLVPEILPGATPRFESTGEAAGRALAELQAAGGCALVVSDVVLGGNVTGVDLLVQCHGRFPRLPFLLTSKLPEEFARGLVEAAHIEAPILAKPFTPAQLRQKCAELVGRGAKAA